jgi:hypothetical protein
VHSAVSNNVFMRAPDGDEAVSLSVTRWPRHAPPGPAFPYGDRRIFRGTLEQAHLFEAAKRPVERPVRRQQASVGSVSERFGDLVSVEGAMAAAQQRRGGEADALFERHQRSRLAAHAINMQISAFKVNSRTVRGDNRQGEVAC